VVFRESFANAAESQVQSYVPPAGGQLARRIDLGFGGPGSYYTDSAYNFAVDARFANLPHARTSAVIAFVMEGPGIQPLDDESWAFDNLGVVTTTLAVGADLSIRLDGSDAVLSWTSVPGSQYLVQSKDALSDPSWSDIPPTVVASGSTTEFRVAPGTNPKFFRLLSLP